MSLRKIYLTESVIERFWLYVQKSDNPYDCWLWHGTKSDSGYGVLRITSLFGKVSYRARAHRISFQIHNGDLDESLVIGHKCNNKLCVNPKHLEQITQKVNIRNAFDEGLRQQLSIADISLIIEMHNKGLSAEEISKKFFFKNKTLKDFVQSNAEQATTSEPQGHEDASNNFQGHERNNITVTN